MAGVASKITVDLGLRWEYYDPIIGLAGKGSLSNYDPTTNSLLVSGYGNIADDFGVKKDLNNFSPRLGVSYRLDDKTVVRGGFGASTTPFPDNRYAFNYPVKQNNSYQTPNSYSPRRYNMAAGFPAPTYLRDPGQRDHQRQRACCGAVALLRAERPPAGDALLVERGVPAGADVGPDGRGGLRRQLQQRRAQPLRR